MRSIRALHIQPHADAPKARGLAAIVRRIREAKTGRRWDVDLDDELTQALDP